MEPIEEAADAADVPPLRTEEGQDDAAQNHPDEGRNRHDSEDVDPGSDVVGLPVGEQVGRRQAAAQVLSRPFGPRAREGAHELSSLLPSPWNGGRRAIAKSTIIPPITIRLGYEMRMTPRWRYPAGESILFFLVTSKISRIG